MAEEKAQRSRPSHYMLRCKSEPIPVGTKSHAKLPRGEELLREPSYLKWWLLGGGATAFALFLGIVIGRFLLP
jgi:hypothetical protein